MNKPNAEKLVTDFETLISERINENFSDMVMEISELKPNETYKLNFGITVNAYGNGAKTELDSSQGKNIKVKFEKTGRDYDFDQMELPIK